MGRTFVLGDVHGAYRALRQCFDKAGFSYESDQLIALGDICDGWPDTRLCVEEILKVKNLVYIKGNHDTWFYDWLTTGQIEPVWFHQGGNATIESYGHSAAPSSHIKLLEDAHAYYLHGSKLFVHAGFDPAISIDQQGEETFLWDRVLAKSTLLAYSNGRQNRITDYEEVYIGHTPIPYEKPITAGGVWLMDTGAGWEGRLSLMDIDTKEVFSSDKVPTLYPGVNGRRRS